MSSMCLRHKYGLYLDSFIISSSSSGGASLVPLAVPRFCLSFFFPNVNMLFLDTTSAIFIMVTHIFLFGLRVVFLMHADLPHAECLDIRSFRLS